MPERSPPSCSSTVPFNGHFECTVNNSWSSVVVSSDSVRRVDHIGKGFVPIKSPSQHASGEQEPPSVQPSDSRAGAQSSQRRPSPIRLPPFAQQMMVNLPMEFLTNPTRIVQGFLVRSWYLHHINIPRSLQARQIMLTGPPHLWRGQILLLWDDFLIPGEDITLDLVRPSPPRNWHETSIVFDLILAQGLYAGRFSGLVSISPTITEPSLRMYDAAVSFAPLISGQDIVTDTDVQDLCNRLDCLIFHGQMQIYLDFNPVHRMQHGDSFVLYLSRKPESLHPQEGYPVNLGDPAPEPMDIVDAPIDSIGDTQAMGSQQETVPAPPPNDLATDADEERRRVNIYRLDRPPAAVWIRWKCFSHLLQDVLEVASISPSELVAVHPLLAKPIGESQFETSVILQHIGDVAPGSADALVLVDTVFHQQGAVTQMFAEPVVDRSVLRVPSPVTRLGLLHFVRVGNFCHHAQNRCIVTINHEVWNTQASTAKTLLHGSYCRIQIPPARTPGVETCRAVSLVEDVFDGSHPTFAQVYPHLPHHSEVNARVPCMNAHAPYQSRSVPFGGVATAPQRLRQCHAADTHQASPPQFEADVPMQAPPVVPIVPEWNDFELEMTAQFAEHSATEVPEEGPILHVTTWYVHHDRAPLCLLGRLVRLSNRPHEWLQLLFAPWIHMLQPFENIALRIVRPSPVSEIPGLNMIHVIIEQGLQQGRYTGLFSVIFQGLHGDVTHRRAQSIPTSLSMDTIARILTIKDLCQARHCSAWSGRLRFHAFDQEPVFSGIGVSFTVDAFRNRYTEALSGDFVDQASASSSLAPPRMPRMSFREDDASLFPSAARAVLDDDITEHAPSRLVLELKVIWEHYLMTHTARPFRFYIETWYCDHSQQR